MRACVRHRALGRLAGWLSLVVVALGVVAVGPALAARGHEFGFALGWGVSADGHGELERCFSGCKPGISGSGKGQFAVPVGVAVNETSGDFYVLDRGNGRVERFAAGGEYLGTFDGSGVFEVGGHEEMDAGAPVGKLLEPQAIAVDNSCAQPKLVGVECGDPSDGDVYVADGFAHKVIDKFTAAGEFVGELTVPTEETGPVILHGLAVDAHGDLWVSEEEGFEHRGFDEFDNKKVNVHIRFVEDEKRKFSSFGLAVGRDGSLFANTEFPIPFKQVVRKFSSGGVVLGVVDQEFSSGVGVEWSSGDVYVDNGLSVGRFTPDLPSRVIERLGQNEVVGGVSESHLISGAGVGVSSAVVGEGVGLEGPVLVADAGAADVVVFSLEGPKEPSVEDVGVSGVTSDSASLGGVVNPRGAVSEYRFEYGVCEVPSDCKSSGFGVQAGGGVVGVALDFEGHAVGVHLQNLTPSSVYHFRLVARNEKNAPGEFVDGPEVVFRTQPGVSVERLLDGRGWEMVSPAHKHGTLVRPVGEQGVTAVAAGGSAVTFETDTPTEDEPQGFSNVVQVLARRTRAGWVSQDIGLSHSRATGQSIGRGQEYRFFSEDLSVGLVQPLGVFEPNTAVGASEQTPYLRTNFIGGDVEEACLKDCYTPLVNEGNAPVGVRFGEEGSCPPRLLCGPNVVGVSGDGRHVILTSSVGLTSVAEDKGGLYEWDDGVLSLVSVLASGKPASPASAPTLGGAGVKRGAISSDGSRVVWTGVAGKSLFLRDMVKEETVEVNAGIEGNPVFQAASTDGSKVFFTDAGGELFVYEVESGKALRLTTPVGAGEETRVQGKIAGVSQDGSYVYFVADGKLTEEAPVSEQPCEGTGAETARCSMYVEHEAGGVWGPPQLVAALSGADFPDFPDALRQATVRVSPNGRWLVFMSQLPLTGYDNHDAVSGAADEEVFLYDSSSNRLVCLSCNPSGARPSGKEAAQLATGLVLGSSGWPPSEWLAANVPSWTPYEVSEPGYQSRYLLDDGRVFFDSSDTLVPGDVNGTEDVYEYEPEGIGSCEGSSPTFVEADGGCVGLLSAGTSREESAFLDASTSGSDALFLTSSQLVHADFDSALDAYDAHICTTTSPCIAEAPPEPTPCLTEASCKPSPTEQPELFGAPPSESFSGLGNLAVLPTHTASKPQTRRAQLAKALASCRRHHPHSKTKRHTCEHAAHTRLARPHR